MAVAAVRAHVRTYPRRIDTLQRGRDNAPSLLLCRALARGVVHLHKAEEAERKVPRGALDALERPRRVTEQVWSSW